MAIILVGLVGEADALVGRVVQFFDSSCFASFSKVFVAGFSITCPVCLLEVDVGSLRPINRGQFGVDSDEDVQIIAGQ